MQGAPVSQPPWMTSILSTPLGKWPPTSLSGLPITSPEPFPHLPPYQPVCCLAHASAEGLCRWTGGSLSRAMTHLQGLWDSSGLGAAPVARCCGVGSLSQLWTWMLLKLQHRVLCNFGEVNLFLWSSISLSSKWKLLFSH